ncbi:sulfatase-like hydrolase/transferase [Serratia marcescens]|uniref:sulfatase-like hydrolase/transferase n=1 Tax=Serratia marcescens TaxID=615 RepID=UPI001EF79FF6|nr:sulfatase-like hydrolase/transferase [Serratia marcescens]
MSKKIEPAYRALPALWDKLRSYYSLQDIDPQKLKIDTYWKDTPEVRDELALFYKNISVMDQQVGNIISRLKHDGLWDNTIVIFAADNGDGLPRHKREGYVSGMHVPLITVVMLITDNGAAPEGGPNGGFRRAYGDNTTVAEMDAHLDKAGSPDTDMFYQRPWAYAGSTPFRRYKLWPYLGGMRTSLIVSWQKQIQKPGIIRHQYVSIIDLAPTILDAAGTKFADVVDGVKPIPVAGKSFLPTLNSDTAKTRDVQYFELRGQRAITQGAWRTVAMHRINTGYSNDQWQLFNTANDYSESTNLATKYPQKLEELKKLWQQEAQKYTNPPVVDPVPFLYKFNRMEDGMKTKHPPGVES